MKVIEVRTDDDKSNNQSNDQNKRSNQEVQKED